MKCWPISAHVGYFCHKFTHFLVPFLQAYRVWRVCDRGGPIGHFVIPPLPPKNTMVGCVGLNSCDGSTRGKISEERDKTWANLIKKGLEIHPKQDRSNRPVWSWLQRDKLSSAWLQALPSPDSSLSSAEFSEAAAAALCIPSPACSDRLRPSNKRQPGGRPLWGDSAVNNHNWGPL